VAVPWYRWDGAELILELQVQPRAQADQFAGIAGDRVKIRLKAPPVEGQANSRLISFLAKEFKLPQNRVVLERGQTGKRKRVRLISPKRLPPALPFDSE